MIVVVSGSVCGLARPVPVLVQRTVIMTTRTISKNYYLVPVVEGNKNHSRPSLSSAATLAVRVAASTVLATLSTTKDT